jgi:hypothetical protein
MGARSPSAFTTTPANNSRNYVCLTSKYLLVLSPDNITSDMQNMMSLQGAVNDILDLRNNDGGWNISGWTKRGTSADAGAEQSAASYKPAIKQMVDTGKLGYHLTSIGFNRRQDLPVLDNIQFNVINLFKIYN